MIIKNQNDEAAIIALRADLACAQATIAALSIKKPEAPARNRKIAHPTAQNIAKWTPGRTYCWYHGYMKHTGSICQQLENEPKWKKDAKIPGPIHGQYGCRHLE